MKRHLRAQTNYRYRFDEDNQFTLGADWTFRPEILYIRDQSNSVGFNYSSTEYWLNVRKGF